MNRYLPHVYVLPEDDRDRQLAVGFENHHQVNSSRIQVLPPAGGWRSVLEIFQSEYIGRLREDRLGHVIMLIDFDGDFENRRPEFEQAIPADLKDRVAVLGPAHTPEMLRNELGKSYERIGASLADDCFADTRLAWNHPQLKHNEADRQRLMLTVKPILFGT
jgi:hypothetical protein